MSVSNIYKFLLCYLCHSPDPDSGQWTAWSNCTKSCGGGMRFRTRMCGGSGCTVQRESCNTEDCNPEPGLNGKIVRRQ